MMSKPKLHWCNLEWNQLALENQFSKFFLSDSELVLSDSYPKMDRIEGIATEALRSRASSIEESLPAFPEPTMTPTGSYRLTGSCHRV